MDSLFEEIKCIMQALNANLYVLAKLLWYILWTWSRFFVILPVWHVKSLISLKYALIQCKHNSSLKHYIKLEILIVKFPLLQGEYGNARSLCQFHPQRKVYFGCNIHVNCKKKYFENTDQAKGGTQIWFIYGFWCSVKYISICNILGYPGFVIYSKPVTGYNTFFFG